MKALSVVLILLSLNVVAIDSKKHPSISVLKNKKGQKYLANSKGLTLYTFDKDDELVSNCEGRCLKIWPAFKAKKVKRPFELITRSDNSKQVAFRGKPLYFYFKDKKKGDLKGDGLGGVWHIEKIK